MNNDEAEERLNEKSLDDDGNGEIDNGWALYGTHMLPLPFAMRVDVILCHLALFPRGFDSLSHHVP